jgi:hypothetical protein
MKEISPYRCKCEAIFILGAAKFTFCIFASAQIIEK